MTIRVNKNPSLREIVFYADGSPTNDNPVTVGVTKTDGSVLIAPGTATSNPSGGHYTYALPAQSSLNTLTETWSGATVTHTITVEVVGGFYISEAELRSRANMSDSIKFSDDKFLAARNWFEDTFERATGVAWVPRFRRVRLSASGTRTLLLPDLFPTRLLSVRVYTSATSYGAYTADELSDVDPVDSGALERLYLGVWTAGARNVVVEYEHGFACPPSDVVEAAAVAIRDRLVSNVQGNRAYAVQTQDGIIRNSVPGRDRPFGIPEVDAVAAARDHRVPAIA